MEFNTKMIKSINNTSRRFWIVLVGIAVVLCVLGIYLSIRLERLNVNVDAEVTRITELEAKIDSLRTKMAKETERAELFIELYKNCLGEELPTEKKESTDYD
ncbi:MAG: hypothetical protein FWF51_03375 [Chitinivibrionia bacterium]|nr:hypothetical protein [Chitinivibrionia bacterium]